MAKKKAKGKPGSGRPSEAELDRQHQRWLRGCSILDSLLKQGGRCLWILFIVYFGIWKPIEISAGKETSISYVVSFMGGLKAEVWLSWVGTILFGGWAVTERRKRIKERTEKDDRITILEKKIDPSRSSSDLTPDGKDTKIKGVSE